MGRSPAGRRGEDPGLRSGGMRRWGGLRQAPDDRDRKLSGQTRDRGSYQNKRLTGCCDQTRKMGPSPSSSGQGMDGTCVHHMYTMCTSYVHHMYIMCIWMRPRVSNGYFTMESPPHPALAHQEGG